jgi:hypothetical protein
MKTIYHNNKPKPAPENWKELKANRNLFEYAISLFFQNLTKLQIRILTGLKCIGVNNIDQKRISNVIKEYPNSQEAVRLSETLFRLSEAFKYITESIPEISENLYPSLFRFAKLYGSVNILKNFTTWEFALAENYFFEYAETNNEESLNKFIAVWYRPQKNFLKIQKLIGIYDGESRIKFQDFGLEARAKRIATIPHYKKFLIWRFFAHQRMLIAKNFPNTFKTKKVKSEDEFTWADTILAMSQPGDENKTGNTKLAIILSRIERENINYKNLKSKQKEYAKD